MAKTTKPKGTGVTVKKGTLPGVLPTTLHLEVARITLLQQGIAEWQRAINSARNVFFPWRKELYLLYDNLQLDPHLKSVLNKRTTGVTNKRITWVQDEAGDELRQRIDDEVLQTPWFFDLLTYAMDSVPFGPTLIELIPDKATGLIGSCEVVPRANVVPERGYICVDAAAPQVPGLMYRDDPYYRQYILEVGHPKSFGEMMTTIPYLVYKRGGIGDMAQFAELFGMPFRVGKYNPYDESTRTKLSEALRDMGSAGYAVIPDGASIEFHEAKGQSNSGIFKDMVELCDAQMSKQYLGGTLTTEAGDKGARSLGDVHADAEDAITLNDMRRIEMLLNHQLRPRLVALGYPLEAGRFQFDLTRALPLEKRIALDIQVASQVPVGESYWYQTYGIPMPTPAERKAAEDKAAQKVAEQQKRFAGRQGGGDKKEKEEGSEEKDDEEDGATTAQLTAALDALYTPCDHAHHNTFIAAKGDDFTGSDPIMERLAQAYHNGEIKDGHVDPELMKWTADELLKGLFGDGGIEDIGDDDDEQVQGPVLQTFMRNNVFVFSGFKTHATLKEVSEKLMDADGQLRSYNDFKRDVLAINEKYNQRYLKAEYNHAVASGQMFERWQDIQRDVKLFPFLRFSTVGDDRVRPVHARLDGLVKHIDDPFWNTYYPPLDWECRCDVDQEMNGDGGAPMPVVLPVIPEMFANNVGKSGVVFPSQHPYFSKSEKVKKAVDAAVQKVAPQKKALKPSGPPVSKSMKVEVTGKQKATAKAVMDMINKVHGDGKLTPALLRGQDGLTEFGRYTNKDGPLRIHIDFDDEHHPLHLIHEVGHWLDNSGLEPGHLWASNEREGKMGAVMKAIDKSKGTKHLRAIADLKKKPRGMDGKPVDLTDKELREVDRYLLEDEELWARAYSQYIATKANDTALLESIISWDRRRFNGDMRRHWDPQDFAPIENAIDALFKEKGWLSE